MHDIKEELYTKNAINFHFIPTKKFKTVNMVVKCKAPLKRESITKRALLPYVLEKGTKNYPSEQLLMKQLDRLYGAELSIDGAKKGNYHILTFRLEVANEKFLQHEESMTEKALELLHEVVFYPHLEADHFSEKYIQREKVTLKNKISSIQDDKMSYANQRLIDHMCADETYHIHKNGYVEDLASISAKSLFEYYKSMLQQDEMDIYIVGDFHPNEMKHIVDNTFQHSQIRYEPVIAVDDSPTTIKANEVMEKQELNQAKLHIGYRTNITYDDSDYAALHVFNGLFGGFPSSKLFINVREKESLAYYAASRLESHKGLLIVFSGIESSDFEKTRDIIALQMDNMKKGQFTDKEITDVKELIISDLKETLDHSQGIVELLYQQVVGQQTRSPKEFIEKILQVEKEDIVRVAEKITLDTVYVLTGKKEGEQHA